jgi:hypothetical protein
MAQGLAVRPPIFDNGMKLIVFGASGNCGRHFAKLAEFVASIKSE